MAAVWLRGGLVVSGFAGACFLPLLVSGFVVFGCFGFAVCCGTSAPVVLLFAIGFLGFVVFGCSTGWVVFGWLFNCWLFLASLGLAVDVRLCFNIVSWMVALR